MQRGTVGAPGGRRTSCARGEPVDNDRPSRQTERDQKATEADARLDRIYAAEISRLTALGRLLTGDIAAGEDLAQDVFVTAIRSARGNPDYLRDPAWPWLRTVMVRLASRRRRRLGAEIRRMLRLYEGPREEGWTESTIDFVAALQTLPLRMRACVALFYGEDMTTSEVASALGCSAKTVEVQLRLGREREQRTFEA